MPTTIPAQPTRPVLAMAHKELDETPPRDAQTATTPSIGYGPHDPVVDAPRHVWRCGCGGDGRLDFEFPSAEQLAIQGGGQVRDARRAHFVQCSRCGRRGRCAPQAWSAIVEWNRANVDASSTLDAFPFFLLAGLSLDQARERLAGIRSDLEARQAQARQRSRPLTVGAVNRGDSERIDAYLGWVIVAQALVRVRSVAAQRAVDSSRQRKPAVVS